MVTYICIGLAIAVIIFATVYYTTRLRNERASRTIHFKKNKRNHAYYLYRIYSNTPILKRYFLKIKAQITSIYPADTIAINVKATKDFSLSLGIALGIGILIIAFSGGDLFFIGVGLVMTYVLFTQILNGRISKLEDKLDTQFADFLTDVRHYYHDTNDVVDAVYNTLDDIPYEIGLHINKIYEILQSTRTEEEVTKYTDIAPNQFLMMFAAICSTIKEYGDKRLDDGQWLFLKNLNHLKDEINIEILKKRYNETKFRGLKMIAVSPIFFLKPIELWAVDMIPEIQEFYSNGTGSIVLAICFAITLFCYQLLCNLKDGRVDEFKENTLLKRLSELPVIRGLLTAEVNRNYTKSLRIGNNLKITGENIGPREFFLKRIIYGIAIAIAFNIVVIFANTQAKQSLMNDFSSSFETSIVPNAEYREDMRSIADNYMDEVIKNKDYEKQDLIYEIQTKEGIKHSHAEEIAEEIFARADKISNIYYKWWSLIGTVAFFFLGMYIPMFILWYQMSIIKMNMEDEVARFQTLTLILVNVDGITINTLLEWLERFAFCFKTSITTCLLELEASEKKALEKMKENESFPAFRRYVDNLLSIDNVGIVSAFDEIESEREFYKKKREQDNNEIIEQKSAIGRLMCFIPTVVSIGGYLIWPFMQMAMSMLDIMNEAVSSL